MIEKQVCLIVGLVLMGFGGWASADERRFTNGLPDDPDFFPIGVWLQNPALAPRYREAGVNLYIGLWKGPTEAQLKTLQSAGMPVIAQQNDYARSLIEQGSPLLDIVVGWQQMDEPDNAQPKEGGGYGPPVPPSTIIERYEAMRRVDPTRPVYLNLGQGVAWEGWVGRGERTGRLDDYPDYVRGADIVSFDIYPVANDRPQVQGKLWYVAQGVERLQRWASDGQRVWNFIEASRIHADRVASPHELRAQVWMAIVHGSQGISYFVHEWEPKFNDHALLDDPTTLEAVTAINREVQRLARVINSPTIESELDVRSSNAEVPVAAMLKRHDGDAYVFAVGMREGTAEATFSVRGVEDGAEVEVLGEDRRLTVTDGVFRDRFEPWGVHLYRIVSPR